MKEKLRDASLEYHRNPPAGKLAIRATKPLANQYDLSLAYSPGVAAACEAIVEDPLQAPLLTSRGNLVAVVTNGSAVLGLGPIGPLAAKPVMEGKAVLFKKFAGIDVFDLEINEADPDRLVDIVTWSPPSAASTWRISRRRSVSSLNASCGSGCRYRCSMTISTAPPLSWRPPWSTPCAWWRRTWPGSAWWYPAPGPRPCPAWAC